jgi:hypothetical protein
MAYQDSEEIAEACDDLLIIDSPCNKARNKIIHLPGHEGKLVTVVTNILSKSECASLHAIQNKAYDSVPSGHVDVTSETLASELYSRIQRFIPENYKSMKPTRIHPTISLNECTKESDTVSHYNVRLIVEEAGVLTGEVSTLSLVVFLNSTTIEDGGWIRLYERDSDTNFVEFKREMGSVLIYDQTIKMSISDVLGKNGVDLTASIMFKS